MILAFSSFEIEPQQLLILALWLLLAGYVSLFVLALRARVVVFLDARDMAWTLAAPGWVLLGLVVRASLMPAPTDPGGTTALAHIAWWLALGATALSLFISLGFAVRHNGVLLGLFVFSFKLIALVAAVLLAVLLWPVKGRALSAILAIAALGSVAFLINGRRVIARRRSRPALKSRAASSFGRANL